MFETLALVDLRLERAKEHNIYQMKNKNKVVADKLLKSFFSVI